MFTKQARDERWARETEGEIRAAVATAFPGETLGKVSCRTSICQISVEHRTADNRQAFFRSSASAFGKFSALRYAAPDPGRADHVTEVLFFKHGVPLPDLRSLDDGT
jgi:hypothetical protein